jgi:MFS transporter, DHA2 family, multidrug resistance protein
LADTKPDMTPGAAGSAVQPARAGLVLISLIAVAAVANLNLSVANVALPSIGQAFDSSQTTLDLIAVGYSLGLAASVLYLGALGDRYGRKLMLILGMALSAPACLLAAYAPSDGVLFAARLLGGVSAGMAYPTTLALIAALWSGPGRTKSIALWSSIGGGIAALGPLVAGALLEQFWWGSVFLITLPLAGIALVMALVFVPSHVNETTDPVDNLGGVLSVVARYLSRRGHKPANRHPGAGQAGATSGGLRKHADSSVANPDERGAAGQEALRPGDRASRVGPGVLMRRKRSGTALWRRL